MNTHAIRFVTLLAFGLLLSMPVGALKQGAKPAGEKAYSCDLSPAELMTVVTSQIVKDDPTAEINFELHTTYMKDGILLVKMPGSPPQEDSSTTATMMNPISVSEYKMDGSFNSEAFESYVSERVSRLQAREPADGFTCGGSPPDTIIVELIDSCLLGNIKTEYIGRVHPVTGDEEWIIKSSKFEFSDKAKCKPHITKRSSSFRRYAPPPDPKRLRPFGPLN